jgi:hypothetical protein
MFFFLSFMVFFQQNRRTRGQNSLGWEVGWGRGEVAQIMYTHESKCKNDKIKCKTKQRNLEGKTVSAWWLVPEEGGRI